MNDVMGQELLNLLKGILLYVQDGDGDQIVSEAHKEYNKVVRRYRNKMWRQYIRPTLNDNMDPEWIDDALALILVIELVLRVRGND